MSHHHNNIIYTIFQYPQGLKHTVSELDIGHAVGVYPKTKFSMLVDEVEKTIPSLCGGELQHIVLFGIEVLFDFHPSFGFCSCEIPK